MLLRYINKADTASMLTKYARKLSPTFTGTVTFPTPFTLGAVSVLPTGTELNYVDGVTSAIQAQINAKEARIDSIVTVLGDTLNIEILLDIELSTDTVADLSELRLKAPLANPIFTGVQKVSTTDTLSTKAYARSVGGSGGVAIGDVRDEIADSLNVLRPLKANTTAVRMLADTIPFFVFGAGGGNAGDTTLFTTTTIYGAFYNKGSDTLRVTELRCVMGHGLGLDTLDIQVWWNDTLNVETGASTVKLNTAALPIGRPSGTTTGTTDTSFANSKIPPGVWVWCKTPYVPAASLKRKPVYLNVQLSGYKIPKY
jgi:hypothetical protein